MTDWEPKIGRFYRVDGRTVFKDGISGLAQIIRKIEFKGHPAYIVRREDGKPGCAVLCNIAMDEPIARVG